MLLTLTFLSENKPVFTETKTLAIHSTCKSQLRKEVLHTTFTSTAIQTLLLTQWNLITYTTVTKFSRRNATQRLKPYFNCTDVC